MFLIEFWSQVSLNLEQVALVVLGERRKPSRGHHDQNCCGAGGLRLPDFPLGGEEASSGIPVNGKLPQLVFWEESKPWAF